MSSKTPEKSPTKNRNAKEDGSDEVTRAISNLSITKSPGASGSAAEAPTVDLAAIAALIKSGAAKNILVMTGAGISVAAGIPDFRTPGTGLYDNLQKYNLPHPQAVFDIEYFAENPKPFYTLAKELFPTGVYRPTVSHYFIRLLADKGLLLRNYSQNIDGLELLAGLAEEKLIQAHGGFATSRCIACKVKDDTEWIRECIFADRIPYCRKTKDCKGLVKPDIVFFGENLPDRFHTMIYKDFPQANLLIVMGTSLAVQPFASLVTRVDKSCYRVLINREAVGEADEDDDEFLTSPQYLSMKAQLDESSDSSVRAMLQAMIDKLKAKFSNRGNGGFDFKSHKRDVFVQGDCDAGVWKLAELLGWKEELAQLIEASEKAYADSAVGKANAAAKARNNNASAAATGAASSAASKSEAKL